MPIWHTVTEESEPIAGGRSMAVVLARLRMPLIYLGLAAIAVDSFLWDLPHLPAPGDRAPPAGGGGRAGRRAVGGLEQPGRPGAQPPPARLRPDLRHRPGPRAADRRRP